MLITQSHQLNIIEAFVLCDNKKENALEQKKNWSIEKKRSKIYATRYEFL
jgi:hypothetical protein